MALYCVQRAIRNFMVGKHWLWWQLWLAIKPNLRSSKFNEIKAALEAKRSEAEGKICQEKRLREEAEVANMQLEAEKSELERALAGGADNIREMEDKVNK